MAEVPKRSETVPEMSEMTHWSVLPVSVAVNVPDPENGSIVPMGRPVKVKLNESALEVCVQRAAKASAARARDNRFIKLLRGMVCYINR
jgi:hypothetical protein